MDTKKSFTHEAHGHTAYIELVKIEPNDPIFEKEHIEKLAKLPGEWWLFDGLHIPSSIKGQGIADKLLKDVSHWADKNKINLLDEEPNAKVHCTKQVLGMYSHYHFDEISETALIRIHKKARKEYEKSRGYV